MQQLPSIPTLPRPQAQPPPRGLERDRRAAFSSRPPGVAAVRRRRSSHRGPPQPPSAPAVGRLSAAAALFFLWKNLTYDQSRASASARPRAGPPLAYARSPTNFVPDCHISWSARLRPNAPATPVWCFGLPGCTRWEENNFFYMRSYSKKYFIYFILLPFREPIALICSTRRDEQN